MQISPQTQFFQLLPPAFLCFFAPTPLLCDNFQLPCLCEIGGGLLQQPDQPNQKSQTEKQGRKWAKQKTLKYKNMVSNIVNMMLSYIMYQTWEQEQRSTLAQRKTLCKQFLSGVSHLKKSFHNFFNIQKLIDQLKAPFSQLHNLQFNPVFRSLVKNYLHNVCPTAIITSKKITKENKLLHLRLRRSLLRLVSQKQRKQQQATPKEPGQPNNFD